MMKQNQHPNVIYILADDMGYGDFGIFSDGSARTPVSYTHLLPSIPLQKNRS